MPTISDFAFVPATGLEDTGVYPSTPASEAAFRADVMAPSNQVKTFLNGTMKTFLNGMVNGTIADANGKGHFEIYSGALDKTFIVNYGKVVATGLSSGTVAFEKEFPTACLVVLPEVAKAPASTNYAVMARANSDWTKASFYWESFGVSAGSVVNVPTDYLVYIAIGY